MFDHVTFRASDRAATERFYETVLPAIDCDRIHRGEHSTLYGNFELSVAHASAERPPTTGVHLGLCAPSIAAVDAFWRAGTDAGYRSDGEPGPRPEYGGDYYGAFLLDPDGNSIEAVRHGRLREQGLIDHVWLRSVDQPAARDYWVRLAEAAGLGVTADDPGLVRVRAPRGGSLTIATGASSSRGLHLAVPAADRGAVDAWHAGLTQDGYASDGDPGERPYHPNYYAAFVLDPDGHSTELVDHDGVLGPRW